jgi:hypothetical protein
VFKFHFSFSLVALVFLKDLWKECRIPIRSVADFEGFVPPNEESELSAMTTLSSGKSAAWSFEKLDLS